MWAEAHVGKRKTKPRTQAPSDTLAFSYHPDLVKKAVTIFERTNRIPSLDEVANIDVEWFNDIMMVLDYLDWLRNSGREVPGANLWQTA